MRHLAQSLTLRITLAAALALGLGIGASTLILVRQAERDTLTAVRDRELAEAVRTARSLSGRVVKLQQSLQRTAQHLDASTFANDKALAHFLTGQAVLRDMFSGVYLVRPDGRMRMLLGPDGLSQPALNLSDRAVFSAHPEGAATDHLAGHALAPEGLTDHRLQPAPDPCGRHPSACWWGP